MFDLLFSIMKIRVFGIIALVLVSTLLVAGCDKIGSNQENSSKTNDSHLGDLGVASKTDNNSFTDPRDNQVYRTVQIGNVMWMAENLNYKRDDSWCYDNNDAACANYGRLYTSGAAVMACPPGWRLPTNNDWNDLLSAAGGEVAGTKLKSKDRWDGTDDFGFSALPGGYRVHSTLFDAIGNGARWWSVTNSESGDTYTWLMSSDIEDMYEHESDIDFASSVRCVKG